MLIAGASVLIVVFFIITYRVGSGMWDNQDLKVNFYKKTAFKVYLFVEWLFKPKKKAVNVVIFMLLNVYDQMAARFVDLELINHFLGNFANNIVIEACIEAKKDRYFLIKRKYENKSKHMIIRMSDIKTFDYDGTERNRLANRSGELEVNTQKAGIRRIK